MDDVRELLDTIGSIESEKGYNIEYGNKDIDLETMTLQEVLDYQKAKKDDPSFNYKKDSTAIGRYQFMYDTLEDIVRRNPNDFPKDTLMTPEVQDRLATVLLKRRGLDDYRSGKLKAADFARNLSKEWASLPDPATGKSYYDGDALNHSRIDVPSMLGIVQNIGKAQPQRGQAIPASYKRP